MNLDNDIRKRPDGDFPNFEFQGLPMTLRHLSPRTSKIPSTADNVEGIDYVFWTCPALYHELRLGVVVMTNNMDIDPSRVIDKIILEQPRSKG